MILQKKKKFHTESKLSSYSARINQFSSKNIITWLKQNLSWMKSSLIQIVVTAFSLYPDRFMFCALEWLSCAGVLCFCWDLFVHSVLELNNILTWRVFIIRWYKTNLMYNIFHISKMLFQSYTYIYIIYILVANAIT